jgi:hypothetical protein
MNTTETLYDDTDFFSIDGHDTGLPDFVLSMLRIAQIKTAKEYEIREVTPQRINRWMTRHRDKIPRIYRPKEICDKIRERGRELRGGGVKVEATELPGLHYGSPPRFYFTFSKLYKIPQNMNDQHMTDATQQSLTATTI